MTLTRNDEYMEYIGTESEFWNTSLPMKGWSIYTGIYPIPQPELTEVELAQQARAEFKRNREMLVNSIIVNVNGKLFDGDETSQTRMTRAIVGLQASGVPTINWTLADNTTVQVTVQELTEALILSGQRQAEIWVMV